MPNDGKATAAMEWRNNWTVVLAAMVGYSLAAVPVSSIGVMMVPIEQDLGWSRTEIYSGAALISFVAMAIATSIGAGIDRFGPRRIAIGTIILLCSAIGFMSTTTDSLTGWWVRWLLVGIAAAAMPTVWIASIARRFHTSRGLAMAVVLSGSGIGTFLVPIITNALMEKYGWRDAYIGLAIIWALVCLPLILFFFRDLPKTQAKTSTESQTKPAENLPGLTVRQAFRSPSYYKLLLAGFGGIIGGVAIVLNLVPILISTGLTGAIAATIAGLIGISTIVGRITGGWLMDRISAKWIATFSTVSASVLPVLLIVVPGSIVAATAGVIIYGLVGGAKVGALAYLASRHLGQRAFGTLYGAINALIALGVGTAPLLANYIYDVTASYELVMWIAVPILAIAALGYALLPQYPDFSAEQPVNG